MSQNGNSGIRSFNFRWKHNCRKWILLVFGLLIGGCTSPYQKHASEFSRLTFDNKNESLFQVSEHTIDFTEKGIYIFDENLANIADVGNISESNKMIGGAVYYASTETFGLVLGPFFGMIISGMHANKCKELASIWRTEEDMRKNLEKTLGNKFIPAIYDVPKVGFYYWYNESSNLPFSSANVVQSFLYFTPQLFNKSKASEVTGNDLVKLLEQLRSNKIFKTKLKYIGTTDVPCPPCWGNINYFDIVGLEPYSNQSQENLRGQPLKVEN